nr:hypothetical protein GCM10020092_088090 [Actinoplanes digitatis]
MLPTFSRAFAGILPLPYPASSFGIPLLFSEYAFATPADDWVPIASASAVAKALPEPDVPDVEVVGDACRGAVTCWV